MQEEDTPPGTVMDTSIPANDVGSSNVSIKSPTPSQKAREWEKRINQSMGGKLVLYTYMKIYKDKLLMNKYRFNATLILLLIDFQIIHLRPAGNWYHVQTVAEHLQRNE